jgi:tryptophanyl-tRNA synthetase
MSKSYDNTIPLFEGGAKGLKDAIARIVTDSKLPGEPKDPDSSSLLMLYRAFADAQESDAFRMALIEGLGWGEAKQRLFERIERDIAPMRARYEALIADPEAIEALLQVGARKARALAAPLLAELREAVGLRHFAAGATPTAAARTPEVAAPPQFKQYRDADGQFYFKLVDGSGRVLLQSVPFASPRDAGQRIAALRREGLAHLADTASLAAGVGDIEVAAALAAIGLAELEKQKSKP